MDEALCFGWIDSILKPIDEARCALRLTPRRAKRRALALLGEGWHRNQGDRNRHSKQFTISVVLTIFVTILLQ